MTPSNRQNPTVAIHTHGCKLNQADSSRLAHQFLEAGYQVVPDGSPADVFVLNTCTVTAVADAKARQALRSARRRNPDAIVVATGCYPQRASEELERMDAVTLVVDNTAKESLVSLVTSTLDGNAPQAPAGGPIRRPESVPLPWAGPPGSRLRAMVKIQEGCNQVCAYCIVPKVRGRERSIPAPAIIGEINRRASEGALEVVLTGTQLGSYGFDLPGTDLVGLLEQVLSETTIPRLRVSSLQPQEINGRLLSLWGNPRLCPHFHVPLQNGCDAILRAMRRRYDTRQAAQAVERIRRAIPAAGVTTDVIVGFPGEGELEFQESLAFAKSLEFSDMHVFPYSVRPGTGAAHLPDHVSPREKKDRVAAMLSVSRRHYLHFRHRQHGQVRPVLWEKASGHPGEPRWSGLTDNYIRVSAPSPMNLENTITQARLGDTTGNSVDARVLSTGTP